MRSRVVTGLVLGVTALLLVFAASPFVGWAASLVLGFLGGLELVRLVSPREDAGMALAFGCVGALLAATLSPLLALVASIAGAIFLTLPPGRGSTGGASSGRGVIASLAGLAWLGGGLAALRALVSHHPPEGTWDPRPLVLLLLLPIWAADTFAFFGGRAFGKRLLAPEISPKKTVEGALCGLVSAVVVAGLVSGLVRVPIGAGLFVGLVAGTLGPAGDLLESLLKRRVNLKDSGTLLPGHGGVLDRIDSLLLASPPIAILLLR